MGDTTLSVDEMIQLIAHGEVANDFETGRISEDEFLTDAIARCQLSCDIEKVRAHLEEIFWPNEDVCNLIPKLAQSHSIYLLSNTNATHARRFQQDYASTLGHFDRLFMSHELGVMKPDSQIYERVQQEIGLPSESLLFVDDLEANIEAARSAGWNGIVYRGIERLKQELKDYEITESGGTG